MALASNTVSEPGSGLIFINTYGTNVPTQMEANVTAAEDFLESHFTNNVTVNIDFEYQPGGNTFAGENSFNSITVTYAQYVAALASHETTANNALAVASLPTTDPSNGAGFNIPLSEAVALGLTPQTNDQDITVTLNSSLAWTFGQDVTSVFEHEITEGAFGRVGSLGIAASTWAPMDLFRFTAAGVRDYTGGQDGQLTYFGVNGQNVTDYQFHNSVDAAGTFDGFDLADWDAPAGDAFGSGGPGDNNVVSATDLEILNILGWTPTGSGEPIAQTDTVATSFTDTTHPFGNFSSAGIAMNGLTYAGDRNWYVTTLYAGITYTITETGQHGGGGTLADPYLRLNDSTGATIAFNDDIVLGTDPDSLITYTPTTSGTYYVEAGAYQDGYTGTYTLGVSGSITLPTAITTAIADVLRATPGSEAAGQVSSTIAQGLSAGSLTQAQALSDVVQAAAGTTSVADLSYQFFTGVTPTAAGLDFLISPTGSNTNNLNSPYYQNFNIENRFINFAVNLGAVGAGEAAFSSAYGGLSLTDATSEAYAAIFGTTPTAAKVSTILNTEVSFGGITETRAAYFAFYGGDGADGLGTKAAMVGWLLAEATTSNLGDYALSNQAYLNAVATGAAIGVNLIGQYDQASYHYTGG